MFTGLIQQLTAVLNLEGDHQGLRLTVQKPASETFDQLQLGESIAVNGACLTVTSFDATSIHFFLGQETLLKTTLSSLKKGEVVNVERSLALGDRLGGHMVTGHIDQIATVMAREMRGDCLWLKIGVLPEQFKLMIPKGSVALDGVSLTINSVNRDDRTFEVLLIPETLLRTNLSRYQVGDKLNIECDQMVKIIAHHMANFSGDAGEFLRSLT